MDWQSLTSTLKSDLGFEFTIDSVRQVSGGDINKTYVLRDGLKAYFIKINDARLLSMFEAEWQGLNEIASTQTIRVPLPLSCGLVQGYSYLLMEHLNLKSSSPATERLLGEQLAQLHRIEQPYFGWFLDNTIGSTPQLNKKNDSWAAFWQSRRLEFQLDLAKDNGFSGSIQSKGQLLLDKLDNYFEDYHPQPSLVHGDLWGGNASVDESGIPVIYDPACYYADREVDIAMTELFGGFGSDFYAAYNDIYALDSGYQTRKTLYNLYHILNHLNLFGSGYLGQTENMLTKLLADLG